MLNKAKDYILIFISLFVGGFISSLFGDKTVNNIKMKKNRGVNEINFLNPKKEGLLKRLKAKREKKREDRGR